MPLCSFSQYTYYVTCQKHKSSSKRLYPRIRFLNRLPRKSLRSYGYRSVDNKDYSLFMCAYLYYFTCFSHSRVKQYVSPIIITEISSLTRSWPPCSPRMQRLMLYQSYDHSPLEHKDFALECQRDAFMWFLFPCDTGLYLYREARD